MKTSPNSAYFGTNFCICSYILLFLVRTVKVYQDQKKISKIFWHHVTLYINTICTGPLVCPCLRCRGDAKYHTITILSYDENICHNRCLLMTSVFFFRFRQSVFSFQKLILYFLYHIKNRTSTLYLTNVCQFN